MVLSRRVHIALLIIMLIVIFYLVVLAVTYHEEKDSTPRVWLLRSYKKEGFGIYVNETVWELTPTNVASFLQVDAY